MSNEQEELSKDLKDKNIVLCCERNEELYRKSADYEKRIAYGINAYFFCMVAEYALQICPENTYSIGGDECMEDLVSDYNLLAFTFNGYLYGLSIDEEGIALLFSRNTPEAVVSRLINCLNGIYRNIELTRANDVNRLASCNQVAIINTFPEQMSGLKDLENCIKEENEAIIDCFTREELCFDNDDGICLFGGPASQMSQETFEDLKKGFLDKGGSLDNVRSKYWWNYYYDRMANHLSHGPSSMAPYEFDIASYIIQVFSLIEKFSLYILPFWSATPQSSEWKTICSMVSGISNWMDIVRNRARYEHIDIIPAVMAVIENADKNLSFDYKYAKKDFRNTLMHGSLTSERMDNLTEIVPSNKDISNKQNSMDTLRNPIDYHAFCRIRKLLEDFIRFFRIHYSNEFLYISSGLDVPSIPSEYMEAVKTGKSEEFIDGALDKKRSLIDDCFNEMSMNQ